MGWKFLQKCFFRGWTLGLPIVIVGALSLTPLTLRSEDPAAASGPEAAADLRVKIFELQAELDKARKAQAGLTVQVRELESRLREHETGIAVLATGEHNPAQLRAGLLDELVRTSNSAANLERRYDELVTYCRTALGALKAEPGILQDFDKKSALVREDLRVLREAGTTPKAATRGTVLSVNQELQAVAVTLGHADSVAVGDQWTVEDSGKTVATLRTTAVRRALSLAAVVEGRIEDIPAGAAVKKKN